MVCVNQARMFSPGVLRMEDGTERKARFIHVAGGGGGGLENWQHKETKWSKRTRKSWEAGIHTTRPAKTTFTFFASAVATRYAY